MANIFINLIYLAFLFLLVIYFHTNYYCTNNLWSYDNKNLTIRIRQVINQNLNLKKKNMYFFILTFKSFLNLSLYKIL